MVLPRPALIALSTLQVAVCAIVLRGEFRDDRHTDEVFTGWSADDHVALGAAVKASTTTYETAATDVLPVIGIELEGESIALTVNAATPVRLVLNRGASTEPAGALQRQANKTAKYSVRRDTLQNDGGTFVVAQDGSIVFVGEGGQLTANTGSSSASGNVAVGVEGSALTTGTSSNPANETIAGAPHPADHRRHLLIDPHIHDVAYKSAQADATALPRYATSSPTDAIIRRRIARAFSKLSHMRRFSPGVGGVFEGTVATVQAPGQRSQQPRPPWSHANASALGMFPTNQNTGMGIALSGFEDHSVSAIGDDQILTYDDSNVFIDRQGEINANTGDTDSSGLNAVDVRHSWVRSGNSGDAESPGDEEEEESEVEPDSVPGQDRARLRQMKSSARRHTRHQAVTQDPDDDEESEDMDVQYPKLQKDQSFATVTDEGASAAIGKTTFVIGADGFDDVSIRSSGNGNIITYDDSNIVIGGTGKVNAQIGDSDTGGAVVMGIFDSIIEAGCEGDMCYRTPQPKNVRGRVNNMSRNGVRARLNRIKGRHGTTAEKDRPDRN